MILFILVVCLLIGLFELVRYREKSLYLAAVSKLQVAKKRLEILKAFSFVLTSKNQSLEKDLNDIAASFFKQSIFNSFILILHEDDSRKTGKIFRYTSETDSFSRDFSKHLTPLEEYVSSRIKTSNLPNESAVFNMLLENIIRDAPLRLENNEKLYRSVVAIPLCYCGKDFGIIVFFSQLDIMIDDKDKNFLRMFANIVAMLIRKFQFIDKIDYSTRLKTVGISW